MYALKTANKSHSTLNFQIYTFKVIRDYLTDRGFAVEQFALKYFKKQTMHFDPLTLEEVEKITTTYIDYGKHHGKDCSRMNLVYNTLSWFMYCTGSRFTESVMLKVKDVDLSGGKAHFDGSITKNGQAHTVFLEKNLITLLSPLVEGKTNEAYVFDNTRGNPVIQVDYSKDLKARAVIAGVNKRVYPHLFRKSYGSELSRRGVPIQIIARLLNHKDIKTAYENYISFFDEQLRSANASLPANGLSMAEMELIEDFINTVKRHPIYKDERFVRVVKVSDEGLEMSVKIKDTEH